MFQNACRMFQNAPECRQNVPECIHNVPECSGMLMNACRMFKNVPECTQIHAWACIQVHELACSSMSLHTVPWACMKFHEVTWSSMGLHAVAFFVWAAHKNFAVLVFERFSNRVKQIVCHDIIYNIVALIKLNSYIAQHCFSMGLVRIFSCLKH